MQLPRFWTTEAYEAVHGIYDGRFPAAVPLGTHGDRTYFIGMHRHDKDFTDAEIRSIDTIRPTIAAALTFRARLDEAADRIWQLCESGHAPAVIQARSELTLREREVLALVAAGGTNRQIGHRLGITERPGTSQQL